MVEQLNAVLAEIGEDIKELRKQLATQPTTTVVASVGISPLNPITVFEGRPDVRQNTIIPLSQSVIGHQCLFYWQDSYLSGFGSSGNGIYATQHAFVPAFPNKVDFAHSVTAAIVPSDSGLSTVQIAYSLDGQRLRIGRSSGNSYRLLRVDIIS